MCGAVCSAKDNVEKGGSLRGTVGSLSVAVGLCNTSIQLKYTMHKALTIMYNTPLTATNQNITPDKTHKRNNTVMYKHMFCPVWLYQKSNHLVRPFIMSSWVSVKKIHHNNVATNCPTPYKTNGKYKTERPMFVLYFAVYISQHKFKQKQKSKQKK